MANFSALLSMQLSHWCWGQNSCADGFVDFGLTKKKPQKQPNKKHPKKTRPKQKIPYPEDKAVEQESLKVFNYSLDLFLKSILIFVHILQLL